jgi:hypothetical protein
MARKTARARSGSDRASLYQEITDKIIAELESGRLPCDAGGIDLGQLQELSRSAVRAFASALP